MKRRYLLSGIALLGIGLGGCSESSEAPSDDSNRTEDVDKSIEDGKQKGKLVKESTLMKKARFHADLIEENRVYRLFVFSEDETSYIEEEGSYLATTGDVVYEGNYQIAFSIKGTDFYRVQDNITLYDAGKMRWNQSIEMAEKIDDDMVAIYQPEGTDRKSAILLMVKKGRLMNITPQEGLLTTEKVKRINENTFQSAEYINGNPNHGWVFSTFQLQKEKLSLLEQTHYWEDLGQYWHELWLSKKENYVPYQNLEPDPSWLEEAAQGRLPGVSFSLGTAIDDIRKVKPKVMNEGFYSGGPYISYPEETYYYDDTNHTHVIGFPGNRVGMSLDQFIQLVGQPDSVGEDDTGYERYAFYQIGEKRLYITADSGTDKIHDISLYAE